MKQDAEFYYEQAERKFWGHDVEGSFIDLEEAIRLDPSNVKYYMTRGLRRNYREEYELGIADFTKIIELSSDVDELAEAYWERSVGHQLLRQLDSLLTDLTWLIEHGKVDSRIYTRRGYCNKDLGRFEEAVEDFSAAIQLSPDSFELWLQRAQAAYQATHYEEAIQDLTQVLHSKNAPPTIAGVVYQWRGKANYRLSKFQAALDDFNQIRALNGDSRSSDLQDFADMIDDRPKIFDV